ncbi:MAG: PD40 domain-containing protein [Chloroflexi bacterium]|nr:PD40 domain-containing protein [Chloroflexota bacterium]
MNRSWKILFFIFLAMLFGSLIAPRIFAGAPTGSSPNDPLPIPGDWQTIAPNSSLWFYFDYGADRVRSKAALTVNTNGIGEMYLSIYTPAQAIDWLRDQTIEPVGRGTPYRDTRTGEYTRDLYWFGSFNTSGKYFAVITNKNQVAIPFLLTATGDTVNIPTALPPTPTAIVPPAFAATPVPTGTLQGKIVFQGAIGGMIYTVNGDGSDLRIVTDGIDPAFSPDGKQIAFARWSNINPGLFVINADGSNERLIFGSPKIRSPRWSPDGKFIAFTQDKPATNNQPLWKLGLIELNKVIDAETTRTVLTEPQCSRLCYAPSWKNDGATLVYVDPQYGIMATNILTGSASLVMGPTGTYYDTGKQAVLPILHLPPLQQTMTSPDGSRVAFIQRAHDRWEINLVSADGGVAIAITQPNAILYTFFGIRWHNVAPVWSPDGKQILFMSDRNGKWEFFVMNADGSNTRQVLKNITDSIQLRFDFENERMMDWSK